MSFCYDAVKSHIKTDKIVVIWSISVIDIASYVPIGLSLASKDEETAKTIKALQNKYLKIRICDDILGVEICGSIKILL